MVKIDKVSRLRPPFVLVNFKRFWRHFFWQSAKQFFVNNFCKERAARLTICLVHRIARTHINNFQWQWRWQFLDQIGLCGVWLGRTELSRVIVPRVAAVCLLTSRRSHQSVFILKIFNSIIFYSNYLHHHDYFQNHY